MFKKVGTTRKRIGNAIVILMAMAASGYVGVKQSAIATEKRVWEEDAIVRQEQAYLFHTIRDELDECLVDYNADYNALVGRFNDLLAEYNTLVDEYNDLLPQEAQ